jgi:glycine reductase
MTKEIERAGLPVVHVTNLTKIAEGIGSKRIFRGNSIVHVLGDPQLSPDMEARYREQLLSQALKLLEDAPVDETSSIIYE